MIPLRALLVAVWLAIPTVALGARIDLTCTSTSTVLEETEGGGTKELEKCVDPTSWITFAVGIELLALQLTGERQIVEIGASPSIGVQYAWRHEKWTFTPMVLGVELLLSMTVLDADGDFDHVEAWTVFAVNLFGYFAVGIGGRYGIATKEELDDFAHLVMTAGLRIPVN